MCGDNVAIEEVAKGEYMKWSVAEAHFCAAEEGRGTLLSL